MSGFSQYHLYGILLSEASSYAKFPITCKITNEIALYQKYGGFTKQNSPAQNARRSGEIVCVIVVSGQNRATYFTSIMFSSTLGSITRFTSQVMAFASLKAALARISSQDAPNFTLYVPAAVSHLEADSLKDARV